MYDITLMAPSCSSSKWKFNITKILENQPRL